MIASVFLNATSVFAESGQPVPETNQPIKNIEEVEVEKNALEVKAEEEKDFEKTETVEELNKNDGPEISGEETPEAVGEPAEEKAITLIKDGEAIGDYDTINQAIKKMFDLTLGGSKFNFVVQVNKDIDLTEYSQFGWPR